MMRNSISVIKMKVFWINPILQSVADEIRAGAISKRPIYNQMWTNMIDVIVLVCAEVIAITGVAILFFNDSGGAKNVV